MTVIAQAQPVPTPIPGVAHATWAGAADGLHQLSLWRQSLAPGAATPPHRHADDEVVLCLSGGGEVHIDGVTHAVSSGHTIVLPRGAMHQIVNTGDQPMETLGIFGGSPVRTYTPDGSELPLPWRT